MEKLKQAVNYFPVGLQPISTTIKGAKDQLLEVPPRNEPSFSVQGKAQSFGRIFVSNLFLDSLQVERSNQINQSYFRLTPNAPPADNFFIAERIRIADIRKCGRCQCQNCQNERNGILMVKPGEKRLHICPFVHCRKLYGKTSHLKVYNISNFVFFYFMKAHIM